jgi:hypothetical protein
VQMLEGKVVQEMPLNGRNVFNLTLTPGVHMARNAEKQTDWPR